jgi:hypothetical protein
VFEQEEDVADFFFLAQGNELLLQAKAGGVVDGSELDYGDQNLFAADRVDLLRSNNKTLTRGRGGIAWVHRAKYALRITTHLSRRGFIRVHPRESVAMKFMR